MTKHRYIACHCEGECKVDQIQELIEEAKREEDYPGQLAQLEQWQGDTKLELFRNGTHQYLEGQPS